MMKKVFSIIILFGLLATVAVPITKAAVKTQNQKYIWAQTYDPATNTMFYIDYMETKDFDEYGNLIISYNYITLRAYEVSVYWPWPLLYYAEMYNPLIKQVRFNFGKTCSYTGELFGYPISVEINLDSKMYI